MRLLLAARLSKTLQGQTGLESQTGEAEAWAGQNGHEIVAVAADRKGGTSHMWARPNLTPWVTELDKMARYDGIVAYKNDRLSRARWSDEIQIRLWAEKYHKELFIVSPALHWPPANHAEQIAWEIFAAQAHEEWKQTSERYTRMHRYLRTAGRPDGGTGYLTGREPFGFRRVVLDESGHKGLEPDPRLKPYVLGMVSRYLNGDTLISICEWLDSEGVKPKGGGAWKQKCVRDVLSNPALIGRRKDGQGRTILKFEPILDMDTWNRLQEVLEANRVNPKRGPVPEEPCLLAGVIFCALCERPMYRHAVWSRGRRYEYYRCNGTAREPSTCRNMIPVADADAWAESWVTDVIGGHELEERTIIPAREYQDQIEKIEEQVRDLSMASPAYLETLMAFHAERQRLEEERKKKAGGTSRRLTGVLLRDHWLNNLKTVQAKRAWLLAGQVKVIAAREPFQFSVEAFMGEWAVASPALTRPEVSYLLCTETHSVTWAATSVTLTAATRRPCRGGSCSRFP